MKNLNKKLLLKKLIKVSLVASPVLVSFSLISCAPITSLLEGKNIQINDKVVYEILMIGDQNWSFWGHDIMPLKKELWDSKPWLETTEISDESKSPLSLVTNLKDLEVVLNETKNAENEWSKDNQKAKWSDSLNPKIIEQNLDFAKHDYLFLKNIYATDMQEKNVYNKDSGFSLRSVYKNQKTIFFNFDYVYEEKKWNMLCCFTGSKKVIFYSFW
ncbi:hypothetical protein ACA758_03915 [Mycoplasmopsis agassizii]|uniref:hypothetical protein n=1 Tax=Mycoplasmopsis agassizii TaxID=33922 RepID=UPI00352848B5